VSKRLLTIVLATVILGVLVAAVGCGSSAGLPKNVLARVGTVDITQDAFDKELAILSGLYTGRVPDPKTDAQGYKDFEISVLNQMIINEEVRQKAVALSISVTAQEVQDELDKIKQNSFGGDQAKFEEALKAKNLTMDQLRVYYTDLMLVQRVHDAATKDAATPSDAEISAYYDANKASFNQEETRTARHILIAPVVSEPSATTGTSSDATQAEWDAALSKAQKVRADLVGGADWKTEAEQYSDDPGSKNNGGDLGTVKKGQMVAEFEAAVFSLAQDEISQPVKTVYGYHIIQVTGITPAKQQTLDEAKATIETTLRKQKEGQVWKEWLAKTKAELNVVVTPSMEPTTTTTKAGGSATTATS